MSGKIQKEYYTVSSKASCCFEERRSKFIGNISPVASLNQASDFINEIKGKYKDATHNTYAFIIDETVQKYSDDGEPSGTAGMPVLEVLKKNNLSKVAIVVTRYFGGIMLGAPGLVRAYSKCAAEAVGCAGIVKMIPGLNFVLLFGYSLESIVRRLIEINHIEIKTIDYGQDIEMLITLPYKKADVFIKELTDLTSDSIALKKGDVSYIIDKTYT